DRDVFQLKLDSLWRRHFCLRNRVLVLARGQRLSFCRDHAEHRPAGRARAPALDRRLSPVRGSIAGNRRGAAGRGGVAGGGGGGGVGLATGRFLPGGKEGLRVLAFGAQVERAENFIPTFFRLIPPRFGSECKSV